MRFLPQTGFVLFSVLTATITGAQSAPTSQQAQQLRGKAPGTKPAGVAEQAAASVPQAPQAAASLLDQPPSPAQVQLDAGKLSVKADNSTLSGILHDISAKTGMTVDGLSRDQRIFGSYGPAAPREVLSSLLDGMGYNVMMVGSLDNGAPRALTLTARTSGGAATGNHSMPTARQNNNGDDEDDSAPEQQDSSIPPRPETSYPPDANQQQDQQQQQPPANPAQQGQPGQVKTPQQMLQELQQMRQQQLQQQQQQTNPQ